MSMKSCLIAYYSRTGENYVGGTIVDLAVGNTEVVAATIASITGGDEFRIDTVRPYPVGYDECTDVARVELRQQLRPEVKDLPTDIDAYDVVFLGYPNWWGTAPMAVFTFLESYDFSGKTIVPFCTHEGSGMGRSERDIQVACSGASVREGLAIRGGAVQGAGAGIRRWIETSGLDVGFTREGR